uniref:Anion exchange protein n=1 Tax=Macrostomum lignano TaxID=282301 RepID=A0A1I8FCV4_9PLAT
TLPACLPACLPAWPRPFSTSNRSGAGLSRQAGGARDGEIYKPAYFRVASVDPSQPPAAPQQPQQPQQQSTTTQRVRSRPAGQGGLLRATSVRPLFCQLDQLNSVPGPDGLSLTQVWREKFRWIKFEEELEVTGNRWSVPYVPVLSPFSVMEARRQLTPNLVTRLARTPAEEVKRLLLTRHINFVEKVEDKDEENAGRKTNKKYRKKVHKDAEGCSIMVGAVQTSRRAPVSVFVRLEQPLKTTADGNRSAHPPSALSDLVLVAKAVATLMTDEIFHKVAYLANSKVELIAGVDEFLKCSSILPPIGCSLTDRIPTADGEAEHRAPHADQKEPQEDRRWWSTARLRGSSELAVQKRLSWTRASPDDRLVFLHLLWACIAPIITFGGMLSDATNGYLGAMESILSGLICGVSYALFAGQPLTILGSTGPVLVFETIVFKMCDRYHWELPTIPLVDRHYITRFTEESFALLIAVIFVYEALAKLFKISSDYPVNKYWHPKQEVIVECECLPNDNLTELIPVPPKMAPQLPTYRDGNVTVANFSAMDYYSWDHDPVLEDRVRNTAESWVGRALPDSSTCRTKARASSLFPTFVRRLISDFAVMIAICVVTSVDYIMDLHTPKLLIPVSFEPTPGYTYRGWVVRAFGNKSLVHVAHRHRPRRCSPAILVFLDHRSPA